MSRSSAARTTEEPSPSPESTDGSDPGAEATPSRGRAGSSTRAGGTASTSTPESNLASASAAERWPSTSGVTRPLPPAASAEERRPLLIGEAPSKSGDRFWQFPLSGNPARVLCQLVGIPPEDGGGPGQWTWALYERFSTENLFTRYEDATPWSVEKARQRAAFLEVREVNVLLGRKVAEAFDHGPGFFEWGELPAGQLAVMIPHPSGLNRMLNEEATRRLMGATLRDAMLKAAGDE